MGIIAYEHKEIILSQQPSNEKNNRVKSSKESQEEMKLHIISSTKNDNPIKYNKKSEKINILIKKF